MKMVISLKERTNTTELVPHPDLSPGLVPDPGLALVLVLFLVLVLAWSCSLSWS